MSGLVIKGAQKALEFQSGQAGNLDGGSYTHWSAKVHRVICLIGGIASVVFAILALIPAAVTSGVIFLSNALAAHYVHKFSTYQNLEQYVEKLTAKVNDLAQINSELEAIRQQFEEIPDDYRTAIEEGRGKLEEKVQQIHELSVRLAQSEEKLQKLGKVANQICKMTGAISEETIALGKENGQFNEHLERLAEFVEKIDRHRDRFSGEILELDAQTDEFDQLNDELKNQVDVFEDQFLVMKEIFGNAKERIERLEAQVANLRIIVPQALESTAQIQDSVRRREELDQRLDRKIRELTYYEEFLQWRQRNS